MDILFSPYGVGSMPKPVMAEVERRTEDLLRSSSFQRMLELEKKYKMERLRGVSPLLQSSQFPAQLKDGPPPRPERPDSLFPQDAPLMLKAARRTVPLPSLSITIPQSAPSEQPGRPGLGGIEQETEEHSGAATPTNGEPFHKQVKFLAPEDGDDDDEDAMSEQSSICQSPSWEGYGQRKKEKKLEAERRKKEKEQAEKEAKAARKRSSARLSKAPPPPPTTGRDSRPAGLTSADRSISEPLLATPHQLQSAQAAHRPEDVGRAFSVDDLQHSGQKRPALPDVLSGSGFDAGRLAGGPVRDPYSPSIPHDLPYDGTVGPQQDLRRSFSEGPAAPSQQSPPTSASRPDGRSSRDAFPPSASRTPKLRHMSPSGNSRSNSLLQGVASSNRSQESLSAVPSSEGSRRDGYVRYQRAQAAERAMAGLADEQLVCPPTRSSSIQSQHTRRSSLTQEAKSVAMKLVGVRARDDGSKSNRGGRESDYLTFKAIPYSASLAEAPVPVRSAPASPKSRDGAPQTRADERPSSSEMAALRKADGHHEDCSALERPPTSQSSVSSGGPSASGSVPSSHSKRGRSLRDAAKAALSISKGPQRPANNARSSSSIPPYLALRARMHSRASVRTEDNTLGAPADKAPAVAVNSAATTSHLVSGERTETTGGQSANCRASEGSSSSSAYEEGSPLPSPTTTPDTSRPQSAKDVPLPAGEFTRENKETLGLQDDERTLRQSLDSSNSSTPRLGDSEPRESVEVGNEDRWSRTALPIDIDCDAESFITSVSNLENLADPDQGLSSLPSALHTSSHTPEATHSESAAADPTLSIPPRSRRRDNTAAEGSARSSNATSPARERRDGDSGSLQDNAGTTGDKERNIVLGGSSHSRTSSGPAKYSEGEEADETGERTLGRHKKRQQQKPTKTEAVEQRLESERAKEEEAIQVAASQAARNISRHNRTSGSVSSASSTIPSAGSTSRAASPGLGSDFPIPSNPYFTDMAEAAKEHDHAIEAPSSAGSPSPISLPSPLQQAAPKPLGPPRAYSAPTPPSASAAPSRASTPSARSSGTAPVSILKQPKTTLAGGGGDPASSSRPPPPAVLSALPKHMQMQAGMAAVAAARGPGNNNSTAVVVASPLAKMFVECCSCRFYHDMPSKLYECMARPDAVVEDKALGISGAITTMVKCPWCQHNMSRNCCAGYAAVVYLKEKLH